MVIVTGNLKGGVGKTTTSVYLAAIAAAKGRSVTLVDADRQGSAAEWLELQPIDGIEVVEAPSERTLVRAINSNSDVVVVDTPPNDPRIVETALSMADSVVITTRVGGVEPSRVLATIAALPKKSNYGVVIVSARFGTNDLTETTDWLKSENIALWGIVPERVSIASGPEARLSRDGLEAYDEVWRKASRRRS